MAEKEIKGDLKSQIGVVVGHGSGLHPLIKPGFLCFYVVRTKDQWAVCYCEGEGLYDWGRARKGLGKTISGKDFAEHYNKGIGLTVPFWRVKKFIEDSFDSQKITFEWVDEDDEPWEAVFGSEVPEEKILAREARWAKEAAMIPGIRVRTLRGWSDPRTSIPAAGTYGHVVKDSRTPYGRVCIEFRPPLIEHDTQEELPEDHRPFRLYYDFDDLEVVEAGEGE